MKSPFTSPLTIVIMSNFQQKMKGLLKGRQKTKTKTTKQQQNMV